jgi:hypothetical protein
VYKLCVRQYLLVAGLALFAGRASAGLTADTPTDDWSRSASDWFRSVQRSEIQLRVAAARGAVAPADRDAAIAQIRQGAASLRVLLLEIAASDSIVAGPLLPEPKRRHGPWLSGLTRVVSFVAFSSGLTNLALGWGGASTITRTRLGVVSGAAGSVFGMLRPKAPTSTDGLDDHTRTVFREMLLRDTFEETWRQIHELSGDLEDIQDATAPDDSALIALVHHYSGTVERISTVLDVQVPHAATVARTSSGYEGFSDSAGAQLTRLADRLDWLGADWRGWRWLVGRSQRDALGFLALLEQPR